MAITEIAIPPIKTDPETTQILKSQLQPRLHETLNNTAGVHGRQVFGHMLSENNQPVSVFRMVLGIEWDRPEDYHDFIASEDFHAFAAALTSHVTSRPQPQLYETDSSPGAAFASVITEVYRIPVSDAEKELATRAAWKAMVDALKTAGGNVPELSGTSLNLDEKLFLGVLGWNGESMRKTALEEEGVRAARQRLEECGGESFAVAFNKAGELHKDY